METKNASIGEGTKVPHLSYVGDATIGEFTNIGAASVFVNYDGSGQAPHRRSGRTASTGSDNMFVAPVTVGDGAYTAAGSVITKDVPPGSLAVARGQQRNIEGWVARKRAGERGGEGGRGGVPGAGERKLTGNGASDGYRDRCTPAPPAEQASRATQLRHLEETVL